MHRFVATHRLALRLLAALVGLLGAVGIAVVVSATVSRVDLLTIQELRDVSLPALTGYVYALTDLGGTQVILALGAFAVFGLAALRQWRGAVAVALSVAATQVLVAVLKHAVERQRPPARDALTHADGFSFPSGHAAAAMALYALLAWLAVRHLQGTARVIVVMAGAVVVGAIGLSRVYLGVHYPTDVMAGWLVGAVLATMSWLVACVIWPLVPHRRAVRAAI